MEHHKPADHRMSCDHNLAVAFAVHVWMAGRASSNKWLTARQEIAFYMLFRCVCWIFDLKSMNYSCFLGNKSDVVRLDEKQHGGTTLNEQVVQIDVMFLSAILTWQSFLFQSEVKTFFYCVIPENIHTPPPPTDGQWKFLRVVGAKG